MKNTDLAKTFIAERCFFNTLDTNSSVATMVDSKLVPDEDPHIKGLDSNDEKQDRSSKQRVW